jgi:hypothetical protein
MKKVVRSHTLTSDLHNSRVEAASLTLAGMMLEHLYDPNKPETSAGREYIEELRALMEQRMADEKLRAVVMIKVHTHKNAAPLVFKVSDMHVTERIGDLTTFLSSFCSVFSYSVEIFMLFSGVHC